MSEPQQMLLAAVVACAERAGDALRSGGAPADLISELSQLDSHTVQPTGTWRVSVPETATRGRAITITLQNDDEVTLSVVHAPTWPDNRGTTFAWAVGQGATRDGQALLPQPKRDLDRSVVFVPPSGDRAPRETTARVAPARFVTCADGSLRLCRVASGEGVAAVHDPRRDRAGQAILEAVRGSRAPLRFSDWPPLEAEVAFAPLQIHPEEAPVVRDAGTLDRAVGCWFAQLAGDSLGSLVEFQSPKRILEKYPEGVRDLADGGTFNTIAGQPTDDSEMALAMARSVVRLGHYDAAAVLDAYADWYDSRPFDIGNTVGAALRAATAARREGRPMIPAVQRAASQTSQANGALMRLAPLAIFASQADPDVVARLARQDASLTHPHAACQDANVLFAMTIAHAIRVGCSAEATFAFAVQLSHDLNLNEVVQGALADAEESPPADFQHQMGWLRIALQNAFYQLLHQPSLEQALVDTVGGGGDTDTNACIAGALLGAVHGRGQVPIRWQSRVLACRPLEGLPGVRKARPRWLWPCDAEALAERLLRAGEQFART